MTEFVIINHREVFALVTDDEKAEGRALVIATVVGAIPDEAECLKDEDACFEVHPIHLGWRCGDEIGAVYARVPGLAEIVMDALVKAGWAPTYLDRSDEPDDLPDDAPNLKRAADRKRRFTRG